MPNPRGLVRTHARSAATGLSLAAATLLGGAASAADLMQPAPKVLPPVVAAAPASTPIDFAFGARIVSDYNFRGISQTDRRPGAQGYGELQLFDNFLYAGVAAYSVDLPTSPDAEVDLTIGIRPKFGPFTFDLGAIFYYYPGEQRYFDAAGVFYTPGNTDFTELAAKAFYTYESVTVGASVFHTWDLLGSGATGTYTALTGKVAIPGIEGLAVSGELGHYFLGRTSLQLGSVQLPDYTYWNAGVAYTYKVLTLDLRYHDTNLSKTECYTLTADPKGIVSGSGRSNWCSPAFIASLSVDTTLSQLGIFAPAK